MGGQLDMHDGCTYVGQHARAVQVWERTCAWRFNVIQKVVIRGEAGGAATVMGSMELKVLWCMHCGGT